MRRLSTTFLLLLTGTLRASADCGSPPASWGSDWGAYESWCSGCCGTFVRNGTQSRCDPGANWGCAGSSGGSSGGGSFAPPSVPTTMQGAVLQGIQSGIQQGLQNAARQRALQQQQAAEQQARQQAENERAAQTMREDNAAIERDARTKSQVLEQRKKAAADKAKTAEERRTQDISGQMKGLSGPAAAPALAPKDLGARKAPPPAEQALRCAAAEVLSQAEFMGPDGKAMLRDLERDLDSIIAELKKKPAGGRQRGVTSLTAGQDYMAKAAGGGVQLVAKVLVTRDEATGEVRIDVQSSLTRPDAPERAVQNLVVVDRGGRVKDKDASPAAQVCLARIAR